jgi:hypothetical protein
MSIMSALIDSKGGAFSYARKKTLVRHMAIFLV